MTTRDPNEFLPDRIDFEGIFGDVFETDTIGLPLEHVGLIYDGHDHILTINWGHRWLCYHRQPCKDAEELPKALERAIAAFSDPKPLVFKDERVPHGQGDLEDSQFEFYLKEHARYLKRDGGIRGKSDIARYSDFDEESIQKRYRTDIEVSVPRVIQQLRAILDAYHDHFAKLVC